MKYPNSVLYSTGATNSLQPNGSAAMSDGGTQSSSNVISSELSEAGMEISIASKEASKQVIKGKTMFANSPFVANFNNFSHT